MTTSKIPMLIIQEYQRTVPVAVDEIAKELGLKSYWGIWDNGASGRIAKDRKKGGKSGYALIVNRAHSPERRRFTVAHQIAHFLMHRKEMGDSLVDDSLYRSKLGGRCEGEANDFAAWLLMPWNMILHEVAGGADTVEKLAKIFRVSNSCMAVRLGFPFED